jgi:hypothetical protein
MLHAERITSAERAHELLLSPWPRARALAASVVQSRLARFAAIGLVLFGIARSPRAPGRDIHVSAAELSALRAERARRLGVRELGDADALEVEKRAIEDELLVREAQRLGLDDGDAIVRQRLVQKMLFLAEETAGTSRAPTEEEIRAYQAATAERWTLPARLAFVHVVVAGREAAERLRPEVIAWSASAPADAAPPFGDALPVSRSVRARESEVAQTYGAPFADVVASLPVGEWSGPIESRQGFHLVRVTSRDPERAAPLADVHDEVRAALVEERRHEAVDAWLRSSLSRYRVDVDGRAITSLAPSGRAALRGSASGED